MQYGKGRNLCAAFFVTDNIIPELSGSYTCCNPVC